MVQNLGFLEILLHSSRADLLSEAVYQFLVSPLLFHSKIPSHKNLKHHLVLLQLIINTNSSVTNISALLGRTAHTKNWRLETCWLSKDTLTLCTHFVGFLPSKQIKQIFCNSTRSSFLHCKQNVTKECSLVL